MKLACLKTLESVHHVILDTKPVCPGSLLGPGPLCSNLPIFFSQSLPIYKFPEFDVYSYGLVSY